MDISVSLPPALVSLIEAQVESGRYQSSGEVVGEALRLLERSHRAEEDALERARTAWQEGVTSGDAGPLDVAGIKAEGRRRLMATPTD